MTCEGTYTGLGSGGSVPILLRCGLDAGHGGACGPAPKRVWDES